MLAILAEVGPFVLLGFVAQLVDGALGMAFGVIASSTLMAFGVPPVFASAAVHAAEIATTGVSGASHLWQRNVDRELFLKLAFAGVASGAVGAYVLTGLPESLVKPFVTVYLAGMSVLILARAAGRRIWRKEPPAPLVGAGGGLLDAIGGGGWGPLVASTLMASGEPPRPAIGSVGLAEFLITLSVSITFLTQVDLANYGRIVLGLVIGGSLAAPLAGYVVRVLPSRIALILVGVVVGALSLVNLVGLVR